jgi:hypothetical protein
MKKLLYLFITTLFVVLGLAVIFGIWLKDNASLRISNFIDRRGEVKIDNEAKKELKDEAKRIDGKIYEEATEHNPEGDMLPDEIDNTVREKLKEEIKNKM